MDHVILTCALNGVLTDPKTHPVPYTPAQMAQSAKEAFNAGASIVHIHLRDQSDGKRPSWDQTLGKEVVAAIREQAPGMLINLTTGVIGPNIDGPLGLLEATRPEIAALNAGSLNYLRATKSGQWAWPPMLFDNPVEKISTFLNTMRSLDILPECECFDTGIVRSIKLFRHTNLLDEHHTISLVQGVASGMPARPDLLPILIDEMPSPCHWQSIAIGRQEVWKIHQRTAELGGNLRTGLEDTFYLPDGSRASSNGHLIEALATCATQAGRSIASPSKARQILGLNP